MRAERFGVDHSVRAGGHTIDRSPGGLETGGGGLDRGVLDRRQHEVLTTRATA